MLAWEILHWGPWYHNEVVSLSLSLHGLIPKKKKNCKEKSKRDK